MNTAYKLQGIHRHYEWGGQSFIPQLMQVDNAIGKPFAEYWMGAHPSAPAMVKTVEGLKALDQIIQENNRKMKIENFNIKKFENLKIKIYIFL